MPDGAGLHESRGGRVAGQREALTGDSGKHLQDCRAWSVVHTLRQTGERFALQQARVLHRLLSSSSRLP